MSLKTFHVGFVAVSTLLAAGFSAWSLRFWQGGGGALYLALGVLAALATVGLPLYGRWFLKKTKGVSYL